MNIKKLNEELDKYLESFPINEMAIKYGRSLGKQDNIVKAIDTVLQAKQGHVKTNIMLKVKATVTPEEIKFGVYDKIMQNVIVEKQYPITIVWGEFDKPRLVGHGIAHILQNHKNDLNGAKKELQNCLFKKSATYSIGKADLTSGNYTFSFALFNNNGRPEEAVLITAFKRK